MSDKQKGHWRLLENVKAEDGDQFLDWCDPRLEYGYEHVPYAPRWKPCKGEHEYYTMVRRWVPEPKGWISAKERLPEQFVRVLVITENHCIAVGSLLSEHPPTWRHADLSGHVEIAHWMPLPDPPEPEKEDWEKAWINHELYGDAAYDSERFNLGKCFKAGWEAAMEQKDRG